MGIALVPTLAFIIVVGTVSPSRRRMGAAVVAAGWSLVSQAALSSLAGKAGWWVVVDAGVFGIPGDILFGWVMAWGAIPGFLADRLHPVWWVLGALTLDVVFLPVLYPVIVMGPSWIAGEALLLIFSFLPGLLAARWTIQGRFPAGRALIQALAFGGLLVWIVPAAVLAREGRTLTPGPLWPILAGLVLVPASLLGMTAVSEFARRGDGTPLPMDPPTRLVTSGPYSFVSNPMQVSGTLVLLGMAAVAGSWYLMLGALVALGFSAGYAALFENQELEDRFGVTWKRYRKAMPPFRFRYSPLPRSAPATLYIDLGCDDCTQLARFLTGLRPSDLELVHAARYQGPPLQRLRYTDGDFEASGLMALSYALDHTNLVVAMAGWVLRLPGIGNTLQLLADAVGFGPRNRSDDPAPRIPGDGVEDLAAHVVVGGPETCRPHSDNHT